MNEIFEQFRFIPPMLNTASVKVQDTGIFSAVWAGIIWFFTHLFGVTVDVIGVSVLYAILLFIVMVADFITGYSASRKEWKKDHPGEKFRGESKKGLRWVIKYFTYIVGFFVIAVMQKEAVMLDVEALDKLLSVNVVGIIVGVLTIAKLVMMLFILAWELQSIDENFERLGYNFRIFDFLGGLFHSIIEVFKNKTNIKFDNKNDTK